MIHEPSQDVDFLNRQQGYIHVYGDRIMAGYLIIVSPLARHPDSELTDQEQEDLHLLRQIEGLIDEHLNRGGYRPNSVRLRKTPLAHFLNSFFVDRPSFSCQLHTHRSCRDRSNHSGFEYTGYLLTLR
jgi:hypothetical protein